MLEAFRKQVLALDPCVTEEFLKLYVAYKAETNFVDVVPQAKRLRLSLNMAFPEINDPKGICKDVSGLLSGFTKRASPSQAKVVLVLPSRSRHPRRHGLRTDLPHRRLPLLAWRSRYSRSEKPPSFRKTSSSFLSCCPKR